jgi:hypothetical protein
MDDAVRDYIDGIAPDRRPLFDRIHALIVDVHPEVEVVLSYKIPTYIVGENRLYVGAWSHGVSFYGWHPGRDAGFCARHPELVNSRGTIRMTPGAAEGVADEEFRDLFRAVLGS